MCCEGHRSLNEHSQSLRKSVRGKINTLHESKSYSPSFKEKKKKSWRDGAGSLILIFTVGDFTQVQSSPWSRNSPWMCHIGFTALGCNSVLLFFLLYIKWVKLKEIIESETGFLFEN